MQVVEGSVCVQPFLQRFRGFSQAGFDMPDFYLKEKL